MRPPTQPRLADGRPVLALGGSRPCSYSPARPSRRRAVRRAAARGREGNWPLSIPTGFGHRPPHRAASFGATPPSPDRLAVRLQCTGFVLRPYPNRIDSSRKAVWAPISFFTSSVRASTPLRRSLAERRPAARGRGCYFFSSINTPSLRMSGWMASATLPRSQGSRTSRRT